jgi:hypothetical protein
MFHSVRHRPRKYRCHEKRTSEPFRLRRLRPLPPDLRVLAERGRPGPPLHRSAVLDRRGADAGEAGFDGIFFADNVGYHDVFRGNGDAALRDAAQFPINDPTVLISGMAAVTKHLTFGVTCSATYEPPYLLARKFSSLDHLTSGRVGWNIVTSYSEAAARNLGKVQQLSPAESATTWPTSTWRSCTSSGKAPSKRTPRSGTPRRQRTLTPLRCTD